MAQTATALCIRVDSNDKEEFEKFCDEVGISISAAINMYIKTVIREQRIPFDIKAASERKNNNIDV